MCVLLFCQPTFDITIIPPTHDRAIRHQPLFNPFANEAVGEIYWEIRAHSGAVKTFTTRIVAVEQNFNFSLAQAAAKAPQLRALTAVRRTPAWAATAPTMLVATRHVTSRLRTTPKSAYFTI